MSPARVRLATPVLCALLGVFAHGGSPALATDALVEEPVVATIEEDLGVFAEATWIEICPPAICATESATPPENSGSIHCSAFTRTGFRGTRNSQGAISGAWTGMYTTTDCLNGSHDPVHMNYMYITARNAYGSTTYQRAPIRTCQAASRQCSGLTVQANDAACGPCNGWWYMTTNISWRLPDGFPGRWRNWNENTCSVSDDGRQLDCESTKGAYL